MTAAMSYRPSGTATTRPVAIVIGKTHIRTSGVPSSETRIPVVSATSIITVPVTAGVKIRRREASRIVSTTCSSVETTTRLASKLGPPICNANALTARNGTLKLATIRRPEPTRWNRRA